MKDKLNKIAAALAFVIGGMAVFAGAKVLVGNDPGYYVIHWLPLYNYTIGIVTILLTAALLWRNSRHAAAVSLGTFGAHAIVMGILQTAYRGMVAAESVQAMTIRLVVWAIILLLVLWRPRSMQANRKPLHS